MYSETRFSWSQASVLRMNENDFIQDEQTNFCSHMSGVIHTCYSRLKDTCSWLFVKDLICCFFCS